MFTSAATANHPLIITADQQLLDDLLRLAAAGGAEVRVATDSVAARPAWPAAPLVVLGADRAGECVRAGLTPRTSVIVVVRDDTVEPPWQVAQALRAEYVALLPAAEAWLVDRFADQCLDASDRSRVIAVVGGRGGAGASVLATALAVTGRRRGLDTLLIDADPLGGGVDLVLGWERMSGLRWPALTDARGRVHPPALVSALPGAGSLSVLSFDRSELDAVPVEAMTSAVDAGRRARDLVVIDVPRYFDESARVALSTADRTYLVVPAELRACVAARHVASAVLGYCPFVSLVVRQPAPAGMVAHDVGEALGLPLAGVLRTDPRLARALEGGRAPAGYGRGALAQLCRELLDQVHPHRHRVSTR